MVKGSSALLRVAEVFSELGISDIEVTVLLSQKELDRVEAAVSDITDDISVEACDDSDFEVTIRLT